MKLYKVFANGGTVKIVEAEIVKETEKTIKIAYDNDYRSGVGQAFGYRTILNKETRQSIFRTPQEAIEAFIKDQREFIEAAQQGIGDAKRNIKEAEKLRA